MQRHILLQSVSPSDLQRYLVSEKIISYPGALHLDLGCGNAVFIQERAKMYPDDFFVGIDKSKKRILKSIRRFAKDNISNVQLIEGDITDVLTTRVKPNSVYSIYLNFPDPWPKRRHHKHRVVNDEFVNLIACCLIGGGHFFACSDNRDYFLQIHNTTSSHPQFENALEADYVNHLEDYQTTLFEQKWKQQDRCLYYMHLIKKVA